MAIPAEVTALQRDLAAIFGARLQSLSIYGGRAHASHARDAHGHGHHLPALQTMAIVDTLSRDDLQACAARVAGWHDAGLATPLLVVANELDQALDSFPLEFSAIEADHVLVSGREPFETLKVDPSDLRRACEHQARSHLLHLREGFLEARGRADALSVLVVSSARPLASLITSVARLEGRANEDAAAAGRHAERALGVTGGAIADVVVLADVKEISSADALRLFPPYLDAVEKLVKYVDAWK